jgi:hypothetical protein
VGVPVELLFGWLHREHPDQNTGIELDRELQTDLSLLPQFLNGLSGAQWQSYVYAPMIACVDKRAVFRVNVKSSPNLGYGDIGLVAYKPEQSAGTLPLLLAHSSSLQAETEYLPAVGPASRTK